MLFRSFWHWSRVTSYTSTFVLAECCVFAKQSVGPFHCAQSEDWDPLSLSYGARLPSSLTRFHSYALVYSTHPPVSVYGTGSLACTRTFLGTPVEKIGSTEVSPLPLSVGIISLGMRPSGLSFGRAGILTCFPSPTPFGLGLGPD